MNKIRYAIYKILHIRYAIKQPSVYCPKHCHSSVHLKSDVKHLHRPVNPFLHPHLTSSLHTFEACGKSVYNGVIPFSTFFQPNCQTFRP